MWSGVASEYTTCDLEGADPDQKWRFELAKCNSVFHFDPITIYFYPVHEDKIVLQKCDHLTENPVLYVGWAPL